jgi:hypothetical protein
MVAKYSNMATSCRSLVQKTTQFTASHPVDKFSSFFVFSACRKGLCGAILGSA